ncbi:hypothetical protein GQX73_g4837 [Xylaria multiplex]|uniref:Uncharacterized protein n=1 Tax=Xylaria multiplex TaxID=323545 RepID=A0A7C8N5G5_9PEZI|nr:hypothetical protein GQX73_g4837 [Xylaria multiplex]
MDSVEKLFQGFKDPEVDSVAGSKESSRMVHEALVQFLKDPPSEDPDYEYLIFHAKMALAEDEATYSYFSQQLSHLAVQKTINRKDKSYKARQLKYYRWFGLGMKKETYPFPGAKPTGHPSTTRIAALVSSPSCAACGKTNANMRCPDCSFQDDRHIVEKTSYCNKQCLQDHYKTHKPICEGRLMVYHATSLLGHIFLGMQEATYVYPLGEVYKKNGITYLVDDSWDRAGMIGRRIFTSFPKHMVDSEDLYRSYTEVLLWGQSEELGLSMFDLIKYLFKPMCKSMEQAFVYPRNVIAPVCYLSDGKALSICLYRHTVLKVTLKSNEQYVIDLTGAQFGWKETLAPWTTWSDLRSAATECQPFKRTSSSLRAAFLNSVMEMQQQEARATLIKSILKDLNTSLQTNRDGRPFDLNKLLKSNAMDYQRAESTIKDLIRQKVFIVITNEFYKDQYRLWVGGEPGFGINIAKNQAKILKKIWLAPKEYDRLKDSGTDMRKLWVERLGNKVKENKPAAQGMLASVVKMETIKENQALETLKKTEKAEKPSHAHGGSKK